MSTWSSGRSRGSNERRTDAIPVVRCAPALAVGLGADELGKSLQSAVHCRLQVPVHETARISLQSLSPLCLQVEHFVEHGSERAMVEMTYGGIESPDRSVRLGTRIWDEFFHDGNVEAVVGCGLLATVPYMTKLDLGSPR